MLRLKLNHVSKRGPWSNLISSLYSAVFQIHYNYVIMSAMVSHLACLTIVYSTVFQGSKKISNLQVTGLCAGNSPVTGEFPAQRASNAENISIWWHHDLQLLTPYGIIDFQVHSTVVNYQSHFCEIWEFCQKLLKATWNRISLLKFLKSLVYQFPKVIFY